MRSIRLIALMACALVVPTTLAEEWFAWEWDSEPGQKWSMDRDLRIITILQPGSYRFYATLDSENGPLADIQNITAPGVSGTITVSIIREGGANLPGCTELAKMDLTGATTSNVGEVRIAGDAGTLGPLTFGQLNDNAPFVADDVLDTLTIGTLRGTVDCNSLRDFTTTTGLGSPVIDVAEPYASAMVINGSDTLGALTLAGVAATGTVTRGAGSTGAVTIQGDMAGTLEFNGGIVQITSLTLGSLSGSVNLPYVGAGGVTINGDVSGSLHVRGSSGASEILGNITATGSVLFQGDVNNHLYIGTDTGGGNVDGTLEVRGDITGTPRELRCFGSVNGTLTTGPTQGSSNMLFNL